MHFFEVVPRYQYQLVHIDECMHIPWYLCGTPRLMKNTMERLFTQQNSLFTLMAQDWHFDIGTEVLVLLTYSLVVFDDLAN